MSSPWSLVEWSCSLRRLCRRLTSLVVQAQQPASGREADAGAGGVDRVLLDVAEAVPEVDPHLPERLEPPAVGRGHLVGVEDEDPLVHPRQQVAGRGGVDRRREAHLSSASTIARAGYRSLRTDSVPEA